MCYYFDQHVFPLQMCGMKERNKNVHFVVFLDVKFDTKIYSPDQQDDSYSYSLSTLDVDPNFPFRFFLSLLLPLPPNLSLPSLSPLRFLCLFFLFPLLLLQRGPLFFLTSTLFNSPDEKKHRCFTYVRYQYFV